MGPEAKSFVDLSKESILVVFIPSDDDTFASSSHECLHVVTTPAGDWLFNRKIEDN